MILRFLLRFSYLILAFITFFWGLIDGFFTKERMKEYWDWFSANPVDNTILIISIAFSYHYIIVFARFFYAERGSKDYVYMRVELTREDSKLDQEKRTEKDFKEKVAIMQQLYRAIFEISELNIGNIMKTAVWQNDFVSFEMFLEKKN